MQAIVARARANNPNLNFVIGSGTAQRGRPRLGQELGLVEGRFRGRRRRQRAHAAARPPTCGALDSKGRVQFDPGQQKQISQAMKAAAQQLGTPINWGGDFKSFKDAPHFELAGGATGRTSSAAPVGPAASAPARPPARA